MTSPLPYAKPQAQPPKGRFDALILSLAMMQLLVAAFLVAAYVGQLGYAPVAVELINATWRHRLALELVRTTLPGVILLASSLFALVGSLRPPRRRGVWYALAVLLLVLQIVSLPAARYTLKDPNFRMESGLREPSLPPAWTRLIRIPDDFKTFALLSLVSNPAVLLIAIRPLLQRRG